MGLPPKQAVLGALHAAGVPAPAAQTRKSQCAQGRQHPPRLGEGGAGLQTKRRSREGQGLVIQPLCMRLESPEIKET